MSAPMIYCCGKICQKAVAFDAGVRTTESDAAITESRLPTDNQVLRCYKFPQLQRFIIKSYTM